MSIRPSGYTAPVTFFESLVALLLLAILLLQVPRVTGIPYPAMLAAAGVGVAPIPGAPAIMLDGHTALALFIAPVSAGWACATSMRRSTNWRWRGEIAEEAFEMMPEELDWRELAVGAEDGTTIDPT